MHYAFFRVSTASPQTASDELNEFIKSHRVVHVEKQFHAAGADAFWSFCLQWQDGTAQSTSPKTTKVDYRAVLSDAQFGVYSTLRDRRKQLAEKDGIPVYAVATNEQLATMVRDSITTRSALQAIPGFGEAKVERYGDAFLKLLPQPTSKAGESKGPQHAPSPESHPK